jgi:hypothetical protein
LIFGKKYREYLKFNEGYCKESHLQGYPLKPTDVSEENVASIFMVKE